MPKDKTPKGASTRAVAALVFGVLSIICMGFIAGVPAVVIGMSEVKAIKDGDSPVAGEGIAKTGYVLGIIGTAVSVGVLMLLFVFILMGLSLGVPALLRSWMFN